MSVNAGEPIRIFLVDDHLMVRRAVRFVLIGEGDFDVVGEAGTIAEAMALIGPAVPDVVIIDVHLPDGSGVDLCRSLTTEFPSLTCLMLTAACDDQTRDDAAAAGSSGFLLKVLRGQDLTDSVRTAVRESRGRRSDGYLSPTTRTMS